MRGREDIFLSTSDAEKMRLFRTIVNARVAQTPVADRLASETAQKPLVTDVNLRQIALLTGRNYGSVYNAYNGLVEELEAMTSKNASVKKMFNLSSAEVRRYLVEQSHAYHFLIAVFYGQYDSFDEFLTAEDTSKATMLRHLKPMRDFAHTFGVRFSYEGLKIAGPEKRIRLFLTLIFWLATDGAAWPFSHCERKAVGRVVDATIDLFDLGRPNLVTREIAMYYVAVALRRMQLDEVIEFTPKQVTLQYPVPNFIEELDPVLRTAVALPELSLSAQMGESSSLYFLFNFLPFYVTTGTDMQEGALRRFRRYDPQIYTLVMEFLDKLPVGFITEHTLPTPVMNMLTANLFSVAMSLLEFGDDLSQALAYSINDRLHQVPQNETLAVKVHQTLEHVIVSENLTDFHAHLDVLSDSFYRNVLQLATQFLPQVKVKVAVVIEQTLLGYVDLLAFLIAQPMVVLVSPNETDIDDADLVIESATVPDASGKIGPDTHTYKWAANSSNDWFGELYATIRQIWEDKMSVSENVDY